ncbi:multidrug ABC transporter ATP-binding protein [Paenibacillus oryzae]|uniref:Multidrug ABC transporter ATP-binding protein n=1 Tax=Paenibacillus oryzae TaxID=1844972 RepID=A0A1A5Y9E8_9BACL|nr:ABC transporter ATP-binding protein [Paenibacillus oryzae]OBR62198.1 multidrug ABC transporter ATP-binding protein [Paenibacillus oryzae]
MLKLARYLKPHWVAVALAPLLMILEVCMDLLQPKLMASIVDQGIMNRDLAHIQTTGLWMLGTALIGLVGGVGCSVYSSIASQKFGADLRGDLFRKVQSLSFRQLDELKTGSLITRLTSDIVQLQTMVQMLLRIFVRSPMLAIGSIVMTITISPKLALVLAIVVPILFVIMFWLIRRTLPLFSIMQAKLDDVNTVLQENFAGIRVVKAFVRSAYENSRFGRANGSFTESSLKALQFVALNMPILTFILNAAIVAVLWYGGLDVQNGRLPVGELIAFINYVTQVMFSLSMIGMMLVRFSTAKVSAERVQEVLELNHHESYNEMNSAKPVLRSRDVKGEITFDHVSFAYAENAADSANVLKDIHFTAKPGQKLAIIGATGAGKSTLVHLISRLYEPAKGRVTLDGIDIRNMDLHTLRGHVGIVLQEAILFSGTISENITFGKADATEAEIIAAAKAAAAHDFIVKLPEGYNTRLGQRGINLSGGQKQRLSIARALLLKPAVLVMDDSTSAVDAKTEARIQASLRELMLDCTSIIIAQRIHSVRDADQILVLEDGKIEAAGTHDELLRSSPLYQQIYQSQAGKEGAAHGIV